MRVLVAFAVLWTVLCAGQAHAHGGQFGHAQRGARLPPTMPCDCGRIDCPKCSAPGLAEGKDLARRETRPETLERWGELAKVRLTTTFQAERELRFQEAAVRLSRPPLLAVTAGEVRCVEHTLTGVRVPSVQGRRDYLWERDTRLRDPMLVLREAPDRVAVRVFPISIKAPTTATVEAYTLLPAPRDRGPRAYRTGDRFLLVLPRGEVVPADADLVDEVGGRVLHFLSEAAMRLRHPTLLERATEVPCVPALHQATLDHGDAAVTGSTALVALPPGSRAPHNLFVGPPEQAPLPDLLLREPGDPTPPPPPPPPAAPPPPILAVRPRIV